MVCAQTVGNFSQIDGRSFLHVCYEDNHQVQP